MNGSFYQNPTFPLQDEPVTPPGNMSFMESIPMEQSYIENILRLNSTIKYINIEKHRTELFTLYGVQFWAPNRLFLL